MKYGEGGRPAIASTFEFTIRLEPDEVDGGFIAECLEFPGCMSQGETEAEALNNVVDAIMSVFETRMQDQLRSPEFKFEGPQKVKISVT